jgi:hypothetical protein
MLRRFGMFISGMLCCCAAYCQSLPPYVQFTGFTAQSNNEHVYMQWTIKDSTAELQYFTVEKSNNGVQWKTLDTIFENSNAYYSYTDSLPSTGVNYYRIKASGSDGSLYSFSRRAYVDVIANLITVYPNPVSKSLRFQMAALTKGRYLAAVFSMTGVKIAQRVIDHDGKDNYVTSPLPPVAGRGVYWLVLMTKNEFYKQNFLVQ